MKGQTLVELLIAIGIFVVVVSSFAFFILNSYVSGRLAKEITIANFLAEEGIEATRSIRDNYWNDLTTGTHGLVISENTWIFQGAEEDFSTLLNNGIRKIIIEDLSLADPDRKKVISKVAWQFRPDRTQEINLVSYLTNWQKITGAIEVRKPTAYTDNLKKTTNPELAYDYPNGTTLATTLYNTSGDSITFHTWETTTKTYTALSLKYRYHAEAGTDDTYAIAYSITGCAGTFTNLVPLTSAGASDTTISVGLSPSQDLSQLCLKISTDKVKKPDNKSVFTRDIWTEGSY